jgi:hypothetical protein
LQHADVDFERRELAVAVVKEFEDRLANSQAWRQPSPLSS